MTRVQLTYFMQAASVAVGIATVFFGGVAYVHGQIWLAVFDVVFLAANVGLFLVQREIRKALRFIKFREEITLRGVNGENGER